MISWPFANEPDVEDELRWCLAASNQEIEAALSETPLLRARARGLRRNALIVIANRKLRNLAPEVADVKDRYQNLAELAQWTLSQLKAD